MKSRRLMMAMLVSSLLAQAWVPATQAGGEGDAPASGASPVAAGTAVAAETSGVWLRGPFGRVAGGNPDDPATAPPGAQPLDTFVRRAPLLVETDDPSSITKLEVTARPIDDPANAELLSSGTPEFEGPDRSGRSLIVATVTTISGSVSEHAWLVNVPDRQPPSDGLYDIPAPEIIIASAGGRMIGVPGSGCYAYLCVDTGGMQPPETLQALPVGVGEILGLSLGDGSAIAAWKGSLSPLDESDADSLEAGGVLTDTPEAVVGLAGLQAPAPGRWLLDLEVEFDRERGWLRTAYLLDAK